GDGRMGSTENYWGGVSYRFGRGVLARRVGVVLGRRGYARVRRPREVGGRRVEQRRPRRGTTNRQASGAETNRCGNSSFRRLAENERLRGKRLSGVGHLACCCRRLIGSLWDPERASEVRLVDAKTL